MQTLDLQLHAHTKMGLLRAMQHMTPEHLFES